MKNLSFTEEEYVEYYYFCANADDDENEFVTGDMMM